MLPSNVNMNYLYSDWLHYTSVRIRGARIQSIKVLFEKSTWYNLCQSSINSQMH